MANWTSVEITKSDPVPFSARGVTVDGVIVAYAITAVFSCDDGRTLEITDNYNSLSAFKNQARNRLASLNAAEADAVTVGVVDLSVPAPTPPTQDQLDQQAYAAKRQAVLAIKQDVDLGLATQADLDKAVADAVAVKPADVAVVAVKV